MKSLILLFAAFSTAQADTFVAYIVRGAPGLFADASDSEVVSRMTSASAILEVYVETEGDSPEGTVQTHKIKYVESLDDSGQPTAKATKEVGTRFKVKEEGDKVSFHLTDTTLDRWIALAPSKLWLQPVFETLELNSELTIMKGTRIVMGGLEREELHEGKPRKVVRYVIIERK